MCLNRFPETQNLTPTSKGSEVYLARGYSLWSAGSKIGTAWQRGGVEERGSHRGSEEAEREGKGQGGAAPPRTHPQGAPLPTAQVAAEFTSAGIRPRVQCPHCPSRSPAFELVRVWENILGVQLHRVDPKNLRFTQVPWGG